MTDALTKARCTLQKNADETTKAQLKGSRWLLVKNRKNLSPEERQTRKIVLEASPELNACYQLKEDFRQLFNDSTDKPTAARALADWIEQVRATGLKSLITFTNTLQNWQARILNYFDGRFSNGFAEGVNLKIKLLNRRAFGYRNFTFFRLHVLVAFHPRASASPG